MAKKYIIRKRQNKILYFEFILAAIVTAMLAIDQLKLHPAIAIIIVIVAFYGFALLFFKFKVFRYIFSIMFSFVWTLFAFLLGQKIDETGNTTSWVLSIVTFAASIWLHYDHFDFLRKSTLHEYERQ